jgi:acyl-CoA synthetase (AMP-forming)/AMP-acid ligase II
MFARSFASLPPSYPRKCKVTASIKWNFAGRLVDRLGPASSFVDAATGLTIGPAELPRLIAAYGTFLISAGLNPGDRVLIGCALSPMSALVYLGAMYAGLVAVPVDERTLAASASALVEATGARAIWTEASFGGGGTFKPSVLWLQGDLASKVPPAVIPAASCEASDLAALMATSGSTGGPKFVMVSHGNLIANTEAIICSQGLAANEKAMLILPVSYCFGASLMHTHLYQGGAVVFDRRFMFPNKVLQAIAQYDCTTFAGVPTVYNVLLRRSNIRTIPMPGLRRFLQAGGRLARERISEMRELFPQVSFYIMYGQTEATARISCMDPDRWHEKPGSVGLPLDNLSVSIVDEHENAVPTGQIGQLLVKGPSICSGYFNDQEETRRVFRGGWLRTGDLARRDEDGYLWIEGRAGSFLKIRGTRVSVAEVEARVTAIAGVYECGACAVDHPEAGEALVLLIVPDQGATLVTDEIRHRLPANWTLDSIRIVSELPKTSTGKIARLALSALGKELHGAA